MGCLPPLVYVGAVAIGGLLRPGYNHLAHAISELIAAGAPNKPLLNPLFTFYDILLAAFVPAFGSDRCMACGPIGATRWPAWR